MHVLLGSTTLHNYNLLDLVLDTPFGAAPSPPVAPSSPPPPDPPAPPGPPPTAPPTPSHHDDPDRWARTLRDYTRDHATYVLADAAHKDALAAYTTATAASADGHGTPSSGFGGGRGAGRGGRGGGGRSTPRQGGGRGPSHLPNPSSTHPPHPVPPFSPSTRIPCFSPTPSPRPLVPFTIPPLPRLPPDPSPSHSTH
ncbi:unnamed protein product [Closterium sp. Naga37s-1]|nr:unnamed protein product [Closterium sp. Naga37s-1]